MTSTSYAPLWLCRISLTAEVRFKMSHTSGSLFKATKTIRGSPINLKLLFGHISYQLCLKSDSEFQYQGTSENIEVKTRSVLSRQLRKPLSSGNFSESRFEPSSNQAFKILVPSTKTAQSHQAFLCRMTVFA